jgi:hypothetical protein
LLGNLFLIRRKSSEYVLYGICHDQISSCSGGCYLQHR